MANWLPWFHQVPALFARERELLWMTFMLIFGSNCTQMDSRNPLKLFLIAFFNLWWLHGNSWLAYFDGFQSQTWNYSAKPIKKVDPYTFTFTLQKYLIACMVCSVFRLQLSQVLLSQCHSAVNDRVGGRLHFFLHFSLCSRWFCPIAALNDPHGPR